MPELEEKLGAILGNPEMMNQIMAMAQAMNAQTDPAGETTKPPPQKQSPSQSKQAKPSLPFGRDELDMIQKFSALSKQTGLDRQQQTLLKALTPYLSHDRLGKLEKAMHAAKMANFASLALTQPGGKMKAGR